MSPEQWQRLQAIFLQAEEKQGPDRVALLDRACAGDGDLRRRLESMLAAIPTLRLVGSAYYGVGLPDLVRQGRSAARSLSAQPQHVTNS